MARGAGRAVAAAESLTSGRISCPLGAAPRSSEWFRGAIVAYGRGVKHTLLRVPAGPVVSESSARTMATTTAALLGADTVVAVTGAGGPEPQDGQDPGTVYFALYDRGAVTTHRMVFDGTPTNVVERTSRHALEILVDCLRA